jgi:hypothetical protein
MAVSTGTRLGSYEIVGALGEGGPIPGWMHDEEVRRRDAAVGRHVGHAVTGDEDRVNLGDADPRTGGRTSWRTLMPADPAGQPPNPRYHSRP